MDIIGAAREVLTIESKAVAGLIPRLDRRFEDAIEAIYNCTGKIIVMGMGKSGLIGRKIAATLSSTGTQALFLHPAEAGHGDLGIVGSKDIIIAISNSGETTEILKLIPFIKRFSVFLISLTASNSTLSRLSDITLDVSVEREACPMGIVPSASTTATLAMGDTIAIVLLSRRGFKEEDFAVIHPDGSLGRRLLIRVSDLMRTGDELPLVGSDMSMSDTAVLMTTKRLGMAIVCDADGRIIGILTDGDLRRGLNRWGAELFNRRAGEACTPNPRFISKDAMAAEALSIMEERSITSLIVPDEAGRPTGVIHIHDILRHGIA